MTFDEFESVVMNALLAGDDPVLATLRDQWALASGSSREFTESGVFSYFSVPHDLTRCPYSDFTFGDLRIHVGSALTHAEATLTVREGFLSYLDYFVYDGPFPTEPEIISIDYFGPSFSPASAGAHADPRSQHRTGSMVRRETWWYRIGLTIGMQPACHCDSLGSIYFQAHG